MLAFSAIKSTVEQIANDIKSLSVKTGALTALTTTNKNSLVEAVNEIKSGQLGNSTLVSGAIAHTSGNVVELKHIADREDFGSHARLWRIITGIRKSDLSMFNLTLSGYIYGEKALIDITMGGYCYTAARIINTFAVSRGTKHCNDVWMGFDAGNRLNLFLGEGIYKYCSGMTLDVKIHHGNSSAALTKPQLANQANWQIADSPTGTPADNTTWSGITNIVRVPVKKATLS